MSQVSFPEWAQILAPSGKRDPFMDVIGAVANFNVRRADYTLEDLRRIEADARHQNPKHIAAVKRRRKRKRGGPK